MSAPEHRPKPLPLARLFLRAVPGTTLLCAVTILAALTAGARSMAEPTDWTFVCHIEQVSTKSPSAHDLCTVFQDRLALAFPGIRLAAPSSDGTPDLQLDLRQISARAVEARLVLHGQPGEWRGAAIIGKQIDSAFLLPLFDGLIADIPPALAHD